MHAGVGRKREGKSLKGAWLNLLLSIRSPPTPTPTAFPASLPPLPPLPGQRGAEKVDSGGLEVLRLQVVLRGSVGPCSRLWIGPGAPTATGRSRGGCWERGSVADFCLKPAASSRTGKKAAEISLNLSQFNKPRLQRT